MPSRVRRQSASGLSRTYDSHEADQESLRANSTASPPSCGTRSGEARCPTSMWTTRISHLSYAPEIARSCWDGNRPSHHRSPPPGVDGAVDMVEMALRASERQGVVTLDEKATQVNLTCSSPSFPRPRFNLSSTRELCIRERKEEVPSAARRRPLRRARKMGSR
jgi:hypothetical protein